MSVCKFFLQGTCRFGNACKFSHQISTDHSYGAPATTSVLLRNNYSTTNKPAQHVGAGVDVNTLVKTVSDDMTCAENGGQWLLSSYSPFKEKAAFPGFEDHSPEEIRLMFYEANSTSTLEQYKQQLQTILQQAITKVRALQNPSPDIVAIIKQIYDGGRPDTGTDSQRIFGTSSVSNTNIFGSSTTNNTNSIFGQPISPTNTIFGQATAAPTPVFGQVTSTPTPLFGQPNATPVFGQIQPNTTSMFGTQTPVNSNTIFAQQIQSPVQTSTFGQQTPISNPLFQQQNTNIVSNKSPFGQQSPMTNTNSIFGPASNTQNMFLTPNSNIVQPIPTIAQQIPTPNSIFPIQKTTIANPTSIFGVSPANLSNKVTFGNTLGDINQNFYSKIEELSEEDIKWYTNDSMDIQSIPEKPPTYEMCFGS